MNDLYWIATNPALPMDARYAAARQMQQQRKPYPADPRINKTQRQYTLTEEKRIVELQAKGVGQKKIAELLDRSRCAIKSKRYQMRKEQRE